MKQSRSPERELSPPRLSIRKTATPTTATATPIQAAAGGRSPIRVSTRMVKSGLVEIRSEAEKTEVRSRPRLYPS